MEQTSSSSSCVIPDAPTTEPTRDTTICIAVPKLGVYSESFIKAHFERLPFVTKAIITQRNLLDDSGSPILAMNGAACWLRRSRAFWLRESFGRQRAKATARYLHRIGARAVLAEYGPSGTMVCGACEAAGIPLIVHFHGFDATQQECLDRYGKDYGELFSTAAKIVCVSEHMRTQLIKLGAPPAKIVRNVYGVDPEVFSSADPGKALPRFLAVGRFVEKKAPYLTLVAFSRVRQLVPDARLTMVGDGPLLGPCRQLAHSLHLDDAVEFPGIQTHTEVAHLMQQARCFVQCSQTASNGDCEGTPVAILEAGASGLPVVSTRHAGIPDVVVEGVTGLLVDERDTDMMAQRMIQVALDDDLAGRLGRDARAHIASNFPMSKSIAGLATIITDEMAE